MNILRWFILGIVFVAFYSPMLGVRTINENALYFQIDKISGDKNADDYSTYGSTLAYMDVLLMKDTNFEHVITTESGKFAKRDFELQFFTPINFYPLAALFGNQTNFVIRASTEPPKWND